MLTTTVELHEGHALRVARAGEKGPALVLLHGYPDNLQIWSALTPRLAASARVIAFDWPGMGESAAWNGGTTPDAMAARLLRLLDAWGVTRVVLAGHDMGAQPALVFAATHPDRMAGLVVMNSLVLGDGATSWDIRVLRRFRWNEVLIRRLPRLVFARAERTSLPWPMRLPRDVRADLWSSFRRPEVRRFVSRMCGGYQGSLPRLPDLYPSVRCPTLLLWGAQDRHFPPEQGRSLAALLPRARLEVIGGGQHWMAWHAADRVADRILAFLREEVVAGTGPSVV